MGVKFEWARVDLQVAYRSAADHDWDLCDSDRRPHLYPNEGIDKKKQDEHDRSCYQWLTGRQSRDSQVREPKRHGCGEQHGKWHPPPKGPPTHFASQLAEGDGSVLFGHEFERYKTVHRETSRRMADLELRIVREMELRS